MSERPVHPVADLFPRLGGADLAALTASIAADGLHEPVWLYDDPAAGTVLLDGRNRVAACELAGVEVATRTYTGDDPIGFAVALNLVRRHLSAGQRAAVAYELLPLYEAEAATRQAAAGELFGRGYPKGKLVADRPQALDGEPAPRAPLSRAVDSIRALDI